VLKCYSALKSLLQYKKKYKNHKLSHHSLSLAEISEEVNNTNAQGQNVPDNERKIVLWTTMCGTTAPWITPRSGAGNVVSPVEPAEQM
jgi:hypothetical protein